MNDSLLSERAFKSFVQIQDEVHESNLSRLADIRRALVDLTKLVDECSERINEADNVRKHINEETKRR